MADLYTMDTVVMEYENRLTVSFAVDSYERYAALRGIIQMSDDICFCQDSDGMKLLLVFYTHATYYNGRQIIP